MTSQTQIKIFDAYEEATKTKYGVWNAFQTYTRIYRFETPNGLRYLAADRNDIDRLSQNEDHQNIVMPSMLDFFEKEGYDSIHIKYIDWSDECIVMVDKPEIYFKIQDCVDHFNKYQPPMTENERILVRVSKVGEEAGEAIEAVHGLLGLNPRKVWKGKTKTREDVLDELGDVVATAMIAIGTLDWDVQGIVEGRINWIHERMREEEAEYMGRSE